MRSLIPWAAVCLLMLHGAGCRPSLEDQGHTHAEEPVTAQITVWTDRYEVFAEHQAPVAGRPTTFITHVTDLQSREPRREGMVKFVLRQGDMVQEHPQAAPARAGIYLPGLRFQQPGDWQLTLLIPTGGSNATVELGIIKVYANEDAAAHAEFPEAPEGVSFLKEQQWKILSRTDPVTQRHLVERLRLPARILSRPGHEAAVVAPVSGQLMAWPNQSLPRPGSAVTAGQELVLLKPHFSEVTARLAEAQSEFDMAKASLEQAESAYARVKTLAAREAKSERELQEAVLAHQLAQARYTAARELLATIQKADPGNPSHEPLVIELRAPIQGVIDSVTAGPGEVVESSQSILTILNPERLWIRAHVPESGLHRLSSTSHALMELPGDPGRFIPITEKGRGELVSLSMKVDEATRTVPLTYEVVNPDGTLRIGQNVALLVETSRAEDALAVPDTALIEEDNQLIAYVQVSGETFEKRTVKAGIRDAGFVEVLEGLSEGERVVTDGAYAIRLSSISGVIPAHGHAH